MDATIRELEDDIKINKELITAANNITDNIKTKITTINRKEKPLYEYFKRQISLMSHMRRRRRIYENENFKKETESRLIPVENIRTNYIKAKVGNAKTE